MSSLSTESITASSPAELLTLPELTSVHRGHQHQHVKGRTVPTQKDDDMATSIAYDHAHKAVVPFVSEMRRYASLRELTSRKMANALRRRTRRLQSFDNQIPKLQYFYRDRVRWKRRLTRVTELVEGERLLAHKQQDIFKDELQVWQERIDRLKQQIARRSISTEHVRGEYPQDDGDSRKAYVEHISTSTSSVMNEHQQERFSDDQLIMASRSLHTDHVVEHKNDFSNEVVLKKMDMIGHIGNIEKDAEKEMDLVVNDIRPALAIQDEIHVESTEAKHEKELIPEIEPKPTVSSVQQKIIEENVKPRSQSLRTTVQPTAVVTSITPRRRSSARYASSKTLGELRSNQRASRDVLKRQDTKWNEYQMQLGVTASKRRAKRKQDLEQTLNELRSELESKEISLITFEKALDDELQLTLSLEGSIAESEGRARSINREYQHQLSIGECHELDSSRSERIRRMMTKTFGDILVQLGYQLTILSTGSDRLAALLSCPRCHHTLKQPRFHFAAEEFRCEKCSELDNGAADQGDVAQCVELDNFQSRLDMVLVQVHSMRQMQRSLTTRLKGTE